MIPVVVGSHAGSPWLLGCLRSLVRHDAPKVHVYTSRGYEVGVLRKAVTEHDRFLFLQDSVRVLSDGFWTAIGTEPCWLTRRPPMYLGIYDSAALAPILDTFPEQIDKETAIRLEVALWKRLPMPTIWPEIHDHTALRVEHKHGRDNLVLGNDLFEKFKGTWR